MAADPSQWLSPAEYLRRERLAETKSEYVDGFLIAMAGASLRHVRITANIVGEFYGQMRGRPCEVFSQNLRVRIAEEGMYAYPDVIAVCGAVEIEEEERDVLLNPTLIVEVLSPSTESYDRGLKFARYRQRASLQEYVLVAQDRARIERYARQGDDWVLTAAMGLDAVIELPSIGCTLALRDVYDKVDGLIEDPI